MKLTGFVKAILFSIPGYKQRILLRKKLQLESAKAQLLASAERKLTFNAALHQPHYVYSKGVEQVLNFYEGEIRALGLKTKQPSHPITTHSATSL